MAERYGFDPGALGRRVIPRLTSAHNYDAGSLGVYRFLCALQGQGVAAGLAWDWGPLGRAPRSCLVS